MDRQVFNYIDEHYQDHVRKLQQLLKQPSISAENRGISECAELLQNYFIELGCQESQIVETRGHPVVFGDYNIDAETTVMVYLMYDTQPVDDPGWIVPPLEGRIVPLPPFGNCLVARGAINTKGPLRAFLNACESIKAVRGKLPVNLMFVAEGEEELGSRHLHEFLEEYQPTLEKADVVFYPSAAQDQNGKIIMSLGFKGIVYFELQVSGQNWGYGPTQFDIHGSNKAWVDSPVWRMIQALSSMTSNNGNHVLLDGFYENVVPPSPEDEALLTQLVQTFNEEAVKDIMKVSHFIDDSHGRSALLRYLYSPTLNINGIWSGYTGPGTKTVLPHQITAKVDVRLVPNMKVNDVLPQIRQHLDKHGFNEDQIIQLESGYGWAKTSIHQSASQAVLNTYHEFNYQPEIWPHKAGSAPFSMFNGPPLNLPFAMGGIGHGGRAHAPNEYLVIEESGPTAGLATLEKSYVAILDNLAKLGNRSM
ncbi:MAG: M20/M25/M40 family metallo-hydrolase [Candidatus Bathyarchaeota archaeon]|nr:MAG: M20/M25/M40 family metallo-hydrolase [Candidatus Bathyarchaeota archaeon]